MTMAKQRSEEWFTRPEILAARARLDAQYIMLGCSIGSSRMDELVARMRRLLGGEVPDLEDALATIADKGPEPETVATLAEASVMVFTEPIHSLAVYIDELGVAKPLTPGAYGRLWSRHTVDAAWPIWAAREAKWRGASGVIAPPEPPLFG
jgi:hypothetical protein